MPDFRVSDTAAEHPKFRAAGLAAFGLWTAAGSWSMNPARLTDGWIPAYYVKSWPNGPRSARRLVQAGLWIEDTRDGVPGYQYHDWDSYQRLRASFEEDKQKARDRMARVRSRSRSGDVRANGSVDNSGSESTADHSSITADSKDAQTRSQSTVNESLVDNPTTSGNGSGFTRTFVERSGAVRPPSSPSPSPSNHLGGEGSPPRSHDDQAPPPRCPKHMTEPAPGPCGPCADARRRVEAWQAEQERARVELAAALDRARADPRLRCEHGTDAGLYIRPDTGTSPCANCRAKQAREPA